MSHQPSSCHIRLISLLALLCIVFWSIAAFAEEAQPEPKSEGPVKSYYSPIVRLEAEKGFLLITTDSGILWIQVEDSAKPHLKTLAVGDMIDVIVQFRSNNLPPLLKTWKLAQSQSPCKIFDGVNCRK